MADLFATPKQPSLFPVAIPTLKISKHDYHIFYQDERALFAIFLVILHREVVESTLVIGFLLWLEREGYSSYSLVRMIVNSFTHNLINQVADEIVVCFKFLQKKANNFISEGCRRCNDVLLLQYLLDRKRLHLEELYNNGDLISDEVSCIANEVTVKAFDDILEQFIGHGEASVAGHARVKWCMGPAVGFQQAPAVGGPIQEAKFMQNYGMAHQFQQIAALGCSDLIPPVTDFRQPTNLAVNQANAGGKAFLQDKRSPESETDEEVPPHDRTIFLTFSKGYPISESEIIQYFTRMFGDFIESLHMQPVEPDNQPLFARIVARSPSMVRAVIDRDGPHGKSKYIINGKHVWTRKFVPGRH